MNHQPYMEWLFVDDESGESVLTPLQNTQLQDHLQDCELCRSLSDAWQQAGAHLQEQVMVEPEPGFTSRWEVRLEVERRRALWRQTGVVLAFSVGGAIVVFVTLAILTWPWLRSPSVLLWTWLYHIYTLYSYTTLAQDFLVSLFRAATGAIPITWWIVLVGLLSELGVLWIVSFRLLTNPRRITR